MNGFYIPNLDRSRAYPPDKLTELRDRNAAPLDSTTNGDPIELVLKDQCTVRVAVDYDAYTGANPGVDEWNVNIQVSVDTVSYTTIRGVTLTGDSGTWETVFTGVEVNAEVPGSMFVKVRTVKTGNPGDLSFGALLTID